MGNKHLIRLNYVESTTNQSSQFIVSGPAGEKTSSAKALLSIVIEKNLLWDLFLNG